MDPTASGSSAAAAGTGIDYDLLPRLLLAHDADVESEEHLDTSLRVLAPRPLAALDDIPMDGAAEGLEAQGPKKKNKSAPRTSRACCQSSSSLHSSLSFARADAQGNSALQEAEDEVRRVAGSAVQEV
jgi:hypothetical protein